MVSKLVASSLLVLIPAIIWADKLGHHPVHHPVHHAAPPHHPAPYAPLLTPLHTMLLLLTVTDIVTPRLLLSVPRAQISPTVSWTRSIPPTTSPPRSARTLSS